MIRRVVVPPEARAELDRSATWYRRKSPVVARAFRSSIRQIVHRVAERPSSFPEIAPGVRRALTKHFPYAVFFAEEPGTIVILAIKHQAQDPARWPSGV